MLMRQLQREHEADKGAANHAHVPPRLAERRSRFDLVSRSDQILRGKDRG